MVARLHVVTGKGGAGKTTVATALALALAGAGRRVLLAEVEGRQGVARLLGAEPVPAVETEIAEGVGGGSVVGLSIEPRAALLEYLDVFYRLGRAGRALDRVGAVDFIATVAPGLRDILLVGKVYEAVRRPLGGRPGAGGSGAGSGGGPPQPDAPRAYDAVVLDAPPTGRITRFLGIGTELAGLARGGPIAAQSASVAALLRSPSTAVHVVALPEELAVTETAEAVAELRAAGLPVGSVVVDKVLTPLPDLGGAAQLRSALGAALGAPPGAGAPDPLVGALVAQARSHEGLVAAQQRHLAELAALGAPVRTLPALPGRAGVDLAGLYSLADLLLDGLAPGEGQP